MVSTEDINAYISVKRIDGMDSFYGMVFWVALWFNDSMY